jgi:succinate-semialdehyde dehydrogenase / glutarate-semialdehyde dehydrogenase
MESINPATAERIKQFAPWDEATIERAMSQVAAATPAWAATSYAERAKIFRAAGTELRANARHYANLITLEMGKLAREARAEIEKCAIGCEYFADNAERLLRDEVIESDAGKSYVAYQPLGTVLAIMPWNFPFWQVFRFVAPTLMAGNTGLLKHASNVPQCALAIEDVLRKAGLPEGAFRTLLISGQQAERLVADRRIHAVTLTGSDLAGRQVARAAGGSLKKTVLELGGSDAFVVLEDADLDYAATQGVVGRMQNAGQSCIAAKRFILVDSIADDFVARFKSKLEALRPGDPMREETTFAPLARGDLRDELHQQVQKSIAAGAKAVLGCKPLPGPGFFYAPSILDHVKAGMPAYDEEFFGPVAIVLRVRDEAEALKIANDSRFGLGGSVWTRDAKRGERFARQLQAGMAFVNGIVKSDPRLPFGGIKESGYGRELSEPGIREFVNIKTVWIK